MGSGLRQVTGVVTVTDDGGSSGRLRRELGVLPPGDIRSCIAALADDEDLLTRLFQYRFPNGGGLVGHSFGNLFLTALTGITGDFHQAILTAEEILRVRGKIFPLTATFQAEAEAFGRKLLEHLDYVGVVTIEFFCVAGKLVANEFAPRVHNSGHWSIEGAVTSQFENHLRAITGLPLGSTEIRGAVVMYNLVGALPERKDVLDVADAHLHLYGKEPRPGRKLGHLTVLSVDAKERERKMALLTPRLVASGAYPAETG